jgi:hydrogenase nickel incorporation protein HypA/HybF
MHEMSLCQSIVEALREQAERHRFVRVRRVRLEIGPFACVAPDAMQFGFDVVSRGTLAEGATLEIIALPIDAWCMACDRAVAVEQRFDPCPMCGDYAVRISGGDELRIKDLEVD